MIRKNNIENNTNVFKSNQETAPAATQRAAAIRKDQSILSTWQRPRPTTTTLTRRRLIMLLIVDWAL